MRFAITSMATNGEVPRVGGEERDVVHDLRKLREGFEGLDINEYRLRKDVEGKMEVMRQSVEKVENAVYGMIVRGRERPKGWIMDAPAGGEREGQGRREGEVY